MIHKHKGVTLVEMLIVMLIMGIMAFSVGLTDFGGQTGRHEAERLAAEITRLTQKTNRLKVAFYMTISETSINFEYKGMADDPPPFEATVNCKFKRMGNKTDEISYSPVNNRFSPGVTIRVTGADDSIYYTILSPAGRIRTDSVPPKNNRYDDDE